MPRLFDQSLRNSSSAHSETTTRYEIIRTSVEFAAAILFIVGSICFLQDDLRHIGTWLFLGGSLLFGLRPAVRLALELRLVALPEHRLRSKRDEGYKHGDQGYWSEQRDNLQSQTG